MQKDRRLWFSAGVAASGLLAVAAMLHFGGVQSVDDTRSGAPLTHDSHHHDRTVLPANPSVSDDRGRTVAAVTLPDQPSPVEDGPGIERNPQESDTDSALVRSEWLKGSGTALKESIDSAEGTFTRTFRPNGLMWSEYRLVDGKLHGQCREWLPTGQLGTESVYKEGKLDGPFNQWHFDGSRFVEGQYAKGKHTGTWTAWYPDGRLQWEVSYEAGKYHGRCEFRDQTGEMNTETSGIYRQGTKIEDL